MTRCGSSGWLSVGRTRPARGARRPRRLADHLPARARRRGRRQRASMGTRPCGPSGARSPPVMAPARAPWSRGSSRGSCRTRPHCKGTITANTVHAARDENLGRHPALDEAVSHRPLVQLHLQPPVPPGLPGLVVLHAAVLQGRKQRSLRRPARGGLDELLCHGRGLRRP